MLKGGFTVLSFFKSSFSLFGNFERAMSTSGGIKQESGGGPFCSSISCNRPVDHLGHAWCSTCGGDKQKKGLLLPPRRPEEYEQEGGHRAAGGDGVGYKLRLGDGLEHRRGHPAERKKMCNGPLGPTGKRAGKQGTCFEPVLHDRYCAKCAKFICHLDVDATVSPNHPLSAITSLRMRRAALMQALKHNK